MEHAIALGSSVFLPPVAIYTYGGQPFSTSGRVALEPGVMLVPSPDLSYTYGQSRNSSLRLVLHPIVAPAPAPVAKVGSSRRVTRQRGLVPELDANVELGVNVFPRGSRTSPRRPS